MGEKKIKNKEYYINNRDIILNRAKEYYINNKESITEDPKIKEYQKEYRKNMTEKKQKMKEYQKEYRKTITDEGISGISERISKRI